MRLYDKTTHQAVCDVLCLKDETINETTEIILEDGQKVSNFYIDEIVIPVFKNGTCLYSEEKLDDVKNRAKEGISKLDKHLISLTKVEKPYPIVLSKELSKMKNDLMIKLS